VETIGVRELRNDTAAVLRRVEGGETLTVTVSGRPVAALVPLDDRPRFRTWDWFEHVPKSDPGLADDLRSVVGDQTTADMGDLLR
jgi:prevent-host-death family protein